MLVAAVVDAEVVSLCRVVEKEAVEDNKVGSFRFKLLGAKEKAIGSEGPVLLGVLRF